MEQIQTLESKMTYQEFKGKFDRAVNGAVEEFVKIGFYLKYARDTDILTESPYQTIAEFAEAEYGMDKSTTSRFIAINDRFAEGGYSNKLKEQYRNFGRAKLALMLTLPEEITEELSPSYSKAEIQAIKDEVDEEKNISDLEVMMEPAPEQSSDGSLLDMLIRQLGEDNPELYVQMAGIMGLADLQEWTRKAKEILAPDAEKQYSIRISGTGRFLASIRETEELITVTALRTLEKTHCTYKELCDAWEKILPPSNGKPDTDWTVEQCRTSWELEYGREYPGKVKVAPPQRPTKPRKTEAKQTPRKESKVQKAPKPSPAKAEPPKKDNPPAPEPEKLGSTGTEAQSGMEAAGNETVTNCHELPENPIKTGTGQSEEQLPGQIGIEEAIEETEERSGVVSYIEPEPHIPQTAAGQEPEDLDAEWEKEKKSLSAQAKLMNTPGTETSAALSRQLSVLLKSQRETLINMAALIEKELLRRGESF